MRIIRASEIGAFLYCRRAWWYRLQGLKPQNTAQLTAGTRRHQQHSRRLTTAGWLQITAFISLAAAAVLALYTSLA